MNNKPVLALAAISILTLALPVVAAAGGEKTSQPPADSQGRFKLQVEGENGDSVRLEFSTGWLGALIESADIECNAEADRDTRKMMATLAAQGEGGIYTYEDSDRDRVVARRSGGALKIEQTQRNGKVSVVEMPWEAAQCLMMGIDPPGDLGRRIARGEAKLKLDVRDEDGRVRISID